MKIIESMLTNNSCYKIGKPIKVQGLMLHSIGCPQPNASVFARGWNNPNKEVAVHGMIDGNTGEVWQFLPWDIWGWHAGGSANLTHIGVEIGEPDCIRYKPSSAYFTYKPEDRDRAVACAETTYKSAVELFAWLCQKFNLNPLEDGVIIGHAEGHARGVASNHGDPEHLWKQLRMPYTMDTFRAAVAKKLAELNGDAETPDEPQQPEKPEETTYITYQVQRGDTLSGIGVKFGVDWRKLVTFNNLADPNLIFPGQVLKIPHAESTRKIIQYTVQPGDSLWVIAKKYLGAGWKYNEIVKSSGLTGTAIYPGDVLTIIQD